MITEQEVLYILNQINDPVLNKSLVDLDAIKDLKIKSGHVSLKLAITQPGSQAQVDIQQTIVSKLKEAGAKTVGLRFEAHPDMGGQQSSANNSPKIVNSTSQPIFIAVTSGKGGVGKSTVSTNTAVALARKGKKVGIIDADIYGFSVPDMMGINENPEVVGELIMPVEQHGVKVMSMGFFVEDNAPVIWRGPMLGKMLRNFFQEVEWGELDYMILDLPPGTGDVALDVHQMLPQSKEIIVTTPHATAAFVAARAGSMAIKTNHEILGVVENMSYYQLPDGSKDYIFGQGGGERLAQELNTEVLTQIPLGQPQHEEAYIGIYQKQSIIGQIYEALADTIIKKTTR
jgi:ATP-binding protein involved in chromosome partitioning